MNGKIEKEKTTPIFLYSLVYRFFQKKNIDIDKKKITRHS